MSFPKYLRCITCYVLTPLTTLIQQSKYTENSQDDSSEFVKYITLFLNVLQNHETKSFEKHLRIDTGHTASKNTNSHKRDFLN